MAITYAPSIDLTTRSSPIQQNTGTEKKDKKKKDDPEVKEPSTVRGAEAGAYDGLTVDTEDAPNTIYSRHLK